MAKRIYKSTTEQIVLDRLGQKTLKIDIKHGMVHIRKYNRNSRRYYWTSPHIYTCHRGYYWFKLYLNGSRRTISIHHAIYIAATQALIPTGHEIHHIDTNKRHNYFSNLELLTVSGHHAVHNDYPNSWDEVEVQFDIEDFLIGAA